MNHRLLPALALVFALAGCGGGGNEDATSVTPSTNAGLQLTVPTPTYTALSEELQAFNTLNEIRSRCGHGQLAQHAALDLSSAGHARWLTYHATFGHEQTTGSLHFTGASPLDRMIAAGYLPSASQAAVSEQLAYFTSGADGNDTIGFGIQGTRGLLNAPYHANALLDGYRDVGVAIRNAIDAGAPDATHPGAGRRAIVFNTGYQKSAGSQAAAQDDNTVLTYPCDGDSNVTRALYHEEPNPVPGRDLSTSPLGTSIMISLKEGRTLTIDSTVLTNTSSGFPVPLRSPITGANDPLGAFGAHQGYVAADAPLTAHTTYRVSLSGRNNGVSFLKTFTFTTGAD
ncbi:CAP domain-containing protein [Hydrogenophaga sp.]|uniref:CAP domain-containing protein n=1 Tax=Hydrogenophaga sp. TaxID=1904254 RepID=UPI003F71C6DB